MKYYLLVAIFFISNSVKAFADYDTAFSILQPLVMPQKGGYGVAQKSYWIQDSSGYVQDSVIFPATRNYRFDFTGHAFTYGAGLWPNITIRIDGVTKATIAVNNATDSIWSRTFSVNAGKHAVRIAYTDPSLNGTNKVFMGLLYIFSSNTTQPVKYPAITKQELPTYGASFLNSNHFASGHLRGFNTTDVISSGGNTYSAGNFATLHNYGANIFRVWVTLERSGSAYAISANFLDTLDDYITRAAANNIYLVIVITDANESEEWYGSTTLKNSYKNRCIDVVNRYKNNKQVAAFAFANEPSAGVDGHLSEFCTLIQSITSAARAIDPNHVIIFPAMIGIGADELYNITEPLAFSNVVYEFHFYSPFEITHQGIPTAPSNNVRTEYPNSPSSSFYNASYFGSYNFNNMKAETKVLAARRFSKRYNSPIYVGEFTCVAYAPNYSSARWIQDAITIFEGYSWSWCNHSFRRYEPWEPEIPSGRWYGFTYTNAFPTVPGGLSTLDQYRTDTTLSMIILKNYFELNSSTIPITRYYRDADGDSYGRRNVHKDTTATPSGYVLDSSDCNDNNANINPEGIEVCNGVDDDCDDSTDERCKTYYKDADGDGYGTPDDTIIVNAIPGNSYITRGRDCNDLNETAYPGAPEICGDAIDNNCNGQTDENCAETISSYFADSVKYVPRTKNNTTLKIILSKTYQSAVYIAYRTMDGTAKAGVDYIERIGTVRFNPGITSMVFNIKLNPNRQFTNTKYFMVQLTESSPEVVNITNPSVAVVYITK